MNITSFLSFVTILWWSYRLTNTHTHAHTQSADCKHTQHMTRSPPTPPPPDSSALLFSWGSALNKSQTVRKVFRRVIGDTLFSACRSSWLFFVCYKTKWAKELRRLHLHHSAPQEDSHLKLNYLSYRLDSVTLEKVLKDVYVFTSTILVLVLLLSSCSIK